MRQHLKEIGSSLYEISLKADALKIAKDALAYIKNYILKEVVIIESGVKVMVVTRPPEDFKEKDRDTVVKWAEKLRESGVSISYKSDFHQKFTVIDQSVVWYGSVNFLSFATHEKSIMRFENTDIAGQLMDTVFSQKIRFPFILSCFEVCI